MHVRINLAQLVFLHEKKVLVTIYIKLGPTSRVNLEFRTQVTWGLG